MSRRRESIPRILTTFCLLSQAFSICGSSSPPNQLVNFVDLPERAKEGDRVTLICKYDARGSRLHQVRWFLNNEEFYRYVRVGRPQQIDYSLPGTNIDLLASDGDKVLLRKVTSASSGVYRCEVTTEDSYTPIIGEGVMNVSGSGSGSHPIGRTRSNIVSNPARHSSGRRSLSYLSTLIHLSEKLVTLGALAYYLYSMVTFFRVT